MTREDNQRQQNKRKLEMLDQDISISEEHLKRTKDGSLTPSVSTIPVRSSPALRTPFKPPKMSKVKAKTEEFNSEEFEESANKVMDLLNV